MTGITPQQLEAERARIAALRMQMLEMHPFWGYLLLQMRLVPELTLPEFAATDFVRHIWYNPVRTRSLSTAEFGFVLAHEICHQVFASEERQNGRELFKWNLATDYAINAIIAEIPVPGAPGWYGERLYRLPAGCLYEPRYRDQVAETIYEELCSRKFRTGPETVDLFLSDGEGKQTKLPGVSDHGGGIDIHLPVAVDADGRELLRERISAAVENFEANDRRGDLPDSLLRRIGLLGEPKIPWRRLLHRYADAVLSSGDYSLAHPNKRYQVDDLIVPGKYDEEISSIVVAVDSSGSMTREAMRSAAAEIRGLDAQEITLIVADCAVQQVIPFDELEKFLERAEFRGGGGTDHVCVFDYIAAHRLTPRLFIGLSDLFSRFPEKRPPYPVLWIVPESHGEPPWGKVIEL